MGPLLVVARDEGIEAGLLLQQVRRRRLGRFGFQRPMHAFMPAVLLRVAGRDSLDPDPEAEPPDRQLTEAIERVG